MAITRQKKEEILQDLKDKFDGVKIVVFVDYSGLDVKTMEHMRAELRNENADFKIAKKTLLDKALDEKNINREGIASLEGQIAVVFGYKDEISSPKIIHKFTKDFENLKILAGLLDNEFIDRDMVIELASIPSHEELLARIVGSINAPISGFVNVLNGNIRGLVQVFNAISQKS